MPRRLVFVKSETVQSSFEENKGVLEALGISVTTLPAISFRFKSLEQLNARLERPCDYSGLLLTSGRSVEAVRTSTGSSILDQWKGMRNYCVGQTTERRIEAEFGSGWRVRGGADAGNAELLSVLILADLEGVENTLPFLFPCSNLALGTLVTKLTGKGHRVESIEVYETIKHEDLDSAVRTITLSTVDYILFFSPSTVQYFMDSVRIAGLENELIRKALKLIAIGPSTEKEMEKLNLPIFACCAKPTIESLVEILRKD